MNKIIIAIDFASSIISEMKLEKKNVKRFFLDRQSAKEFINKREYTRSLKGKNREIATSPSLAKTKTQHLKCTHSIYATKFSKSSLLS